MQSYKLTATLNGKTEKVTLWAHDYPSAHFQAISEILERAYQKDNAWALGEIVLESDGEILATMSSK